MKYYELDDNFDIAKEEDLAIKPICENKQVWSIFKLLEKESYAVKFFDKRYRCYRILVYPNGALDRIEIKNLSQNLFKPFSSYKTNKTEYGIEEDSFKEMIKKFKEEKRQTKKKKKELQGGVYGIYEDGELVYIGMTMRNFEDRINEHMKNIQNHSNELYMYSKFNGELTWSKLIEIKDLKTNKELTRRDIEAMEFALISLYKPKYNLAGNTMEYKFS